MIGLLVDSTEGFLEAQPCAVCDMFDKRAAQIHDPSFELVQCM